MQRRPLRKLGRTNFEYDHHGKLPLSQLERAIHDLSVCSFASYKVETGQETFRRQYT